MEQGGLIAEEAVEQDGGPEKADLRHHGAGHRRVAGVAVHAVPTLHQRDEFF
ncbi:MAG: hypothetical protein R2856_00910 [Caldilineaceae bacterium]